ncbi:MAG: hypothetical protein U0414_20015 [Polyangiaceae bacterium]
MVCTPNLVEGPRSGHLRVGDATLPKGGKSIPIADVGAFLCAALDDPTWVRKRVGICA